MTQHMAHCQHRQEQDTLLLGGAKICLIRNLHMVILHAQGMAKLSLLIQALKTVQVCFLRFNIGIIPHIFQAYIPVLQLVYVQAHLIRIAQRHNSVSNIMGTRPMPASIMMFPIFLMVNMSFK